MKLVRCEVWNFGSYAHLELDLADLGLSLIHGKTGSGKSTIPDIPCWIMFGITSKNGAADDIRSWQSDQPTKGVLSVQLHEGSITITRVRGKAGQNDLYWCEETTSDKKERGKDATDTQRQLCLRLGVDADLYLSASYFCDFSPSGSFFVARSKDRRDLFEKIASLDFPIKLADKVANIRKAAKKDLDKAENDLAKVLGKFEQLKASEEDLKKRSNDWNKNKEQHKQILKDKLLKARNAAFNLPEIKAKIKFIKEEIEDLLALKPEIIKARKVNQDDNSKLHSFTEEHARLSSVDSESCPTCLSPQEGNYHRKGRLKELNRNIKIAQADVELSEAVLERLVAQVESVRLLQNDLQKAETKSIDILRNIEQCEKEFKAVDDINPFLEPYTRTVTELEVTKVNKASLEALIASVEHKIASLTLLYDLSFDLRGELLKKAVKGVERAANDYLERHFDAELRVSFDIEGSDDLTVGILKSGYHCSFKQLSKGQRQLLKLCFAVSIMKASANTAGVHFSNLFFDESLDGLDDDLKIKAFALFSELETEHESVLLIDHAPAFQNMFSKKYHITMESDQSSLEVENE